KRALCMQWIPVVLRLWLSGILRLLRTAVGAWLLPATLLRLLPGLLTAALFRVLLRVALFFAAGRPAYQWPFLCLFGFGTRWASTESHDRVNQYERAMVARARADFRGDHQLRRVRCRASWRSVPRSQLGAVGNVG